MAGFVLQEEVEEIAELKAIVCVSGPGPLDYVEPATQAVALLPDGAPEPAWVDGKTGARTGNRTSTVDALYEALALEGVHGPRPRRLADAEDLIVSELTRTPRIVIVIGAHGLRTEALEMVFCMWKNLVPGHFPLVLTGESGKLDKVLARPALASLKSCVFAHQRVIPEPA